MLNQLIISVACVFNFLTVAEKLCGDRLTLLLLSIYSYSQNKDASHINHAGVTAQSMWKLPRIARNRSRYT